MDDVGWMDPGFNGGGAAVGNATPNMDKLANEGLLLTSAYSTPSCSPTRATIHTGQNPLHHGILRPPMYGEAGGLDGAITMPLLLKQHGYITQGIGKWHMGENQGSLPQNVGYDDYFGFLGVSDMYTEWRDVYFNPEVALSPERFKMLEKDDFNHYEVHCTPGDKKKCENGKLIELNYIKELDQHWLDTSLAFLDKMKGSKQPFFLYHATRGCHFDNYPSDEWAGKSMSRTVFSDCMVQMDDISRPARRQAAGDRRAREHADPAHLRQRARVRDPAARPHAVPRLQGLELGRRRARADVRLLEGHDQPAQVGRPVRPRRHPADRAVACRRSGRRACRPVSQDDLHRRGRPDVVPGRRRRPVGAPQPHLHA